MQSSRGRGRAALFAQAISEPDEPVSVGRGRALTVQLEEAKPRGRGALYKQAAASLASSLSSGATGQGDADRKTAVSDSTFESGTALTGISSGSDEPRKGRGRAAMFSQTTPSTSDVASAMKDMTLTPKPKEAFAGPSPERKEPVRLHGKQGRPLETTANYIPLEYLDPNRQIQEYEVTFKPQIDSIGERSFVINQHFRNFGGKVKVFDRGFRIFSPDRLHNDVNVASVTLRSGLTVEMTIKFKRSKKFVESERVINIIFKRIMGELQLVKFGRSDFNPKLAHHIREHKLEIWPGFITAIDEYEGGIMLNIDASHRVLRSQTCLDVITDIVRIRGLDNPNYREDVSRALVGESVIANYNKIVYKIDDIDFETTPRGTFMKGNVEISYLEYYKTQYNIGIRDESQPMLVHRKRRKVKGQEMEDELCYLVPELCSPTGLTDEMRSNFQLMKAVADKTRVSPAVRQSGISDFIRGIKSLPKAHQHLMDWNLKLPDKTVDMTARVMEPERIYFGGNKSVTEASADWGRAASNNKMLSAVELNRWGILYYTKNNRNVGEFVDCFRDICLRVGLDANKPRLIPLNNEQTRTYCEEIRKLASGNPQILVIIFPTNRDDRYAAVKKLCNCELGLVTQVINLRTISNQKSLKSVVTKVILQMNCKVGGALWGISIPFKEEGIMFCGIDAYHDAARKTHSVVALVTSTNSNCTRWASGTSLHNRGQEISDVILGLLKDCLDLWHKANRTFPSRVVMYRDGVGDGQLGVVRDFEVPQFYKLFSSIRSDYKPKLTYCVVQKRINTRIFAKERGNFNNPPPGTVVDHSITRRDWFDYFLVSQNVRQGTVSPTHYVVVHDDSEMSVDIIQKLSYKMTHLYYNWNGTVRVPAPCQYAHKLAYLVGQHMHAPATENLRNVLYFL